MFWRKFLPALRYHNLALPIQVEQKDGTDASFAPTLTLHFEATTREALESQVTKPRYSDIQSLDRWRADLSKKRAEEKSAETEGGAITTKKENSWIDQLRKQQEDEGIHQGQGTSVGEITIKPQPAADPSSPSTTSPPVTMFQRNLTLGLRGRYAIDIWHWFLSATGARPYIVSRSDAMLMRHHREHEKKAAVDRERVKSGIDAMKKEKEELRRAREAAERLQSEA